MANKKQQASSGLDQYISANRTTNWMILIFVLTLICMVIVWAFIGTMKTTVPVTGIQENGHFVGPIAERCLVPILFETCLSFDNGNIHAAAFILFSLITTAPS